MKSLLGKTALVTTANIAISVFNKVAQLQLLCLFTDKQMNKNIFYGF
jgi:hypothetical protein